MRLVENIYVIQIKHLKAHTTPKKYFCCITAKSLDTPFQDCHNLIVAAHQTLPVFCKQFSALP